MSPSLYIHLQIISNLEREKGEEGVGGRKEERKEGLSLGFSELDPSPTLSSHKCFQNRTHKGHPEMKALVGQQRALTFLVLTFH